MAPVVPIHPFSPAEPESSPPVLDAGRQELESVGDAAEDVEAAAHSDFYLAAAYGQGWNSATRMLETPVSDSVDGAAFGFDMPGIETITCVGSPVAQGYVEADTSPHGKPEPFHISVGHLAGLLMDLRKVVDERFEQQEEHFMTVLEEQRSLHEEILDNFHTVLSQNQSNGGACFSADAGDDEAFLLNPTSSRVTAAYNTVTPGKAQLAEPRSYAANLRATDVRTVVNQAAANSTDTDDIADSTCFSDDRPPSPSHKQGGFNEVWVDGENSCGMAWRRWKNFVKSTTFDYIFGVVILAQTVFGGIQIDRAATEGGNGSELSQDFRTTETVFACIFLLELLARLSVWHLKFFRYAWNLFDLALVLSSIIDECIKYGIGGDTIAGAMTGFRTLRIFRLIRTFRVIRVIRAFRELRIVLGSMLSCFRSLFWTLILLLVTLYLFAVLLLGELTGGHSPYAGNSEGAILRRQYFPNLAKSLMTLFQCTTGGIDWEKPSSAIDELVPWMNGAWIFYIGFVVFAISNTMTGMFTDQAMKSAQDDMRNVMQEERDKREVTVAKIRQMFINIDKTQKGYVTRKHMEKLFKDYTFRKYLRKLDIDSRDLMAYFDLVASSDRAINLNDLDLFISGAFRLKGIARNVDVVAIIYTLKGLARERRADSGIMLNILRTMGRRPVRNDNNAGDRSVSINNSKRKDSTLSTIQSGPLEQATPGKGSILSTKPRDRGFSNSSFWS